MSAEMDNVKYEVAMANRVLAELGLASGILASLGHASLRVPSDPSRFVVKGRGYAIDALAAMRPEDMIVCDLEGFKLDGPPGSTQCFEVKLHSAIYKSRPDVQSVVHVHPRFTIVMTIIGATLAPMCNEGLNLVRRPLPVYPHSKLITTEEEGMEVAAALGDSQAVLLLGHGAATVGAGLEEAVMNMLGLEEQARMNWYARCAAGPNHPRIPEELITEREAQPPLAELPHFKDVMAQGGQPRVNGVWTYYTDKVSRRA
jgi:ribulose-5-phosphate 4-epimerase/fuculose-1-phosphate aldolase